MNEPKKDAPKSGLKPATKTEAPKAGQKPVAAKPTQPNMGKPSSPKK